MCNFVIPAGQAHALGILMKSDWKHEFVYKTEWAGEATLDGDDTKVFEGFEDHIDDLDITKLSCSGVIKIVDLGAKAGDDNKAIYAGHTCKGFMMKVNIAMSLTNYKLVKQVTAEYDFDLSRCKVDR